MNRDQLKERTKKYGRAYRISADIMDVRTQLETLERESAEIEDGCSLRITFYSAGGYEGSSVPCRDKKLIEEIIQKERAHLESEYIRLENEFDEKVK